MKIMKLITENDISNGYNAIQEVLVEGKDTTSPCKFKATLIQTEVKNRNGRVYPKKLMLGCVDKYIKDRLIPNQWRSFGELGHPEGIDINLDRVSHYITEMHWEDSNVIGTCQLLDTNYGKIANTILRSGCKLGVSTRGMGELGMMEGYEQHGTNVVTEYDFICVDIVADPSAPQGWVNGICESKKYILENDGSYKENNEIAYDKFENSIKTMPKKFKEDYLFEQIKKFLKKLV